jgi:hypothetical protein
MNDVTTYFLIGLVVSLIVETLIMRVTGQNFTMYERIFSICFWPFTVIVFIISMFK